MRLRNPVARRLTLAAVVVLSSSCVMTVRLVPGADRVTLTENASDVAGCKVVGNVSGLMPSGDVQFYSESQLRNRTVGLDGNTVLLTTPREGVAYRCP